MHQLTLSVATLDCAAVGASTLERALAGVPGVCDVFVDLRARLIHIEGDATCQLSEIARVLDALEMPPASGRRAFAYENRRIA